MPMSHGRSLSQDSFEDPNGSNGHLTPSRQPARRRARRKNLTTDDQAEALTEMSVRVYGVCQGERPEDFQEQVQLPAARLPVPRGCPAEVFPCPVCNKEFSRPDKMKNHLKTTHESYMPKADPVYPMGFINEPGQIPPNHTATAAKIESVLSAIQLQQHLSLQKELHSQHAAAAKFQLQHHHHITDLSPSNGGAQAIVVSGGNHGRSRPGRV
nr:protein tramtrack, alpha isoform-like [Aedes albopictus]